MIAAPKILLVDDDEDDSVLIRDMVSRAFVDAPRPDWRDNYDAGLRAMVAGDHDVYLVDFQLGRRRWRRGRLLVDAQPSRRVGIALSAPPTFCDLH